MFNYYCRIAALAKEYEVDGKIEKSTMLKEILKNENRCKSCGMGLTGNCGEYVCAACSISSQM